MGDSLEDLPAQTQCVAQQYVIPGEVNRNLISTAVFQK
jgi:hypothetical protein